MSYKIISDSSCDIKEKEDCNFASVPLRITTDIKEYIDNKDLNVEEMIDDLQKYKGRSGSACPNPEDWKKEFGKHEHIFCITITSALSGSCNSAKVAVKQYTDNNKNVKATVIDSLSTGPENLLIIEKLAELIKEKLPFEEIEHKIHEYMKHTHLLFSLESLTNLANNGRVSKLSAKVAGIMGIRVIGKASDEGTLEILQKARGKVKSLEALFANMLSSGYNGGKVRIHHCLNELAANDLMLKIKEKFSDADIAVNKTGALCSFYAEEGGLLVGYEG